MPYSYNSIPNDILAINMNGKLVIVTGFSGAGKDTVINRFLEKNPSFSRVVTHTDRQIRKNETHGVDYYFISTKTFETYIKTNKFIEHVMYGTCYKGTTKVEIEKVLKGANLVWRIDMSRAATVEDTLSRHFGNKKAELITNMTTKIVVKTSSTKVALDRYIKRDKGNTSLEEFKKRLQMDNMIWNQYRHKFPHTIVNETGKLEKAVLKLEEILGL